MSTPIVPNSNAADDSLPLSDSLHLDPAPYAVELFCDLDRSKQFPTLHYRRESRDRAVALALVPAVLDDLARAGLILTEPLAVKIITANGPYTCYVEAVVRSTAAVDAEAHAFAEMLRQRYGKV